MQRRRGWRTPALVLVLVGGLVGAIASTSTGARVLFGPDDEGTVLLSTSDGPGADDGIAAPSDDPRAEVAPDAADGAPGQGDDAATSATLPLARVGGVLLRLPGTAPIVVGYHEAATAVPLALEPVGVLLDNRNATRVEAPPDDVAGVPYLIMTSRGRRAPATSAVDIVLADDQPILAPVTGTVSDVRTYWLYGTHLDTRLEIRPDDDPSLRVVLVHVRDALVRLGDTVEAGSTVVAAGPTRFPFSSHIDVDTAPDRWPHVHLEVQPFDAPRAGDPQPGTDGAADAGTGAGGAGG